ncbi:MAG: TrpR-like protein YerC/YecD [Clostridia bacterium]|nr:TrpR-like protein YerC/YecD [Clostridia bacterium]
MPKQDMTAYDALFEAFLALETVEECRRFFEDLCTVKELADLNQRLQVAKMLDSGLNYNDISRATGASTATISRIGKCLKYGEDGYRLVLDRLQSGGKKDN